MKKFNKVLTALTAAFSFTAALTTPVSAKEPVYEDYDATRTGSITLYKYVSNDGKSIDSTGQALAPNSGAQLSAIQNATGSYKMLPEQGVTFMYKHIGDYTQVSTNSESKKYVTNLDQAFIATLNSYGITLSSTIANGETMYVPDDVTSAMEKLCKATNTTATGEEAARQFVKNGGSYFDSVTNNYGKTSVSNLAQGLYMVSEVDWEHQSIAKHDTYWQRTTGTEDAGDGSNYADIVSPSSPFLCQIPMNNVVEMTSGGKTFKAGEGWLYDITVYPKNGSLSVHKDIIVNQPNDGKRNNGLNTTKTETLCDYSQVNYANSNKFGDYDQGYDDDTQIDGDKTAFLTHQIDVSIGDTVRQVISSDVPALIGEKLNKKYAITDRMTKGLSFTQLDKVSVGTGTWNDDGNHVLTEGADYTLTVADDKKSFTVDLTAQCLAYLDSVDSASYLYVEFDSVLNNQALIGTDTYKYTTADGNTVDATNQNTAMLTYATDRTGEHDYYSNTCRVYTYELDITKMIPDMPAGKDYSSVGFTMTGSQSEGRTENLQFIKDVEGTYHIYDPVSDAGNTPVTTVNCSADGKLAITGVDARDYVITEVSTVKGKQLLAAPVTIRLEGHKQVDGYSRYFENGVLDHAYAWTGEEPLKLAKYDIATGARAQLDTGRAPFLITNEGFSMLRTGGNGNMIAMAIGIAALIACGGCWMIQKKKRMSD